MNPRWIEEMGWRMGEVYAAITDRILINLARHFQFISEGAPISETFNFQLKKLAEMGQVTRETEKIILDSLQGGDQALRTLLEETIRESLKNVTPALRKAAEKGLLTGAMEVAPNQMQTFFSFYRQAADKLNLVNTTMLESTIDLYRETVSDVVARFQRLQGIMDTTAGMVISGVQTLNQAVKEAVQKMVEVGITGFIDRGGHHWSPEAYVTMDTRTTMANTARESIFEQNRNFNNDLFSVSWHSGARPLCFPWQGKVIAKTGPHGKTTDLNGKTIEVYALSETTYGEPAGLFGINCGHFPIPFIPGYSLARQPEQDEAQNAKEYAESQRQRALERKLRYEKRDLQVLKAQGAGEAEIKAQRIRVRNARVALDNFCEETGRARRTGRERTPIQATWPDGKEN